MYFSEEGRRGEWAGGGGGAHPGIPQETVQPHPGRQEPEQEGREEEINYFGYFYTNFCILCPSDRMVCIKCTCM